MNLTVAFVDPTVVDIMAASAVSTVVGIVVVHLTSIFTFLHIFHIFCSLHQSIPNSSAICTHRSSPHPPYNHSFRTLNHFITSAIIFIIKSPVRTV